MMMTKRKSLYKDPNYDVLDKELRISVKTLLLIFFLVVGFFVLAFIAKGPTYGVL